LTRDITDYSARITIISSVHTRSKQ